VACSASWNEISGDRDFVHAGTPQRGDEELGGRGARSHATTLARAARLPF
jgi:hypothetical protein